ncbi:MAG: PDZ domain-containing protein [Gemmatimonadota bacterium]
MAALKSSFRPIHDAILELSAMRGIIRRGCDKRARRHVGLRRVVLSFVLLSGIALPCFSGPLVAQTAEERARAELLRQQAEALRQREQERQLREQELRERLEYRHQELEEAMAQAREQREAVRSQYRAQIEEMRRAARDQAREARQVVVRLRARVRLGISMNGNQADEVDRRGVEVQGVMEDSPAEEAGLLEGDIITHLNGQSLVEPIPAEEEEDFEEDQSLPVQRLVSLTAELDEGDQVEIRYLRDGTPETVSFEVAEWDSRSVMVYGGEGDELEDLRIELKELGELGELRVKLEDLHVEMDELREMRELRDLYVAPPRVHIRADPEGLTSSYVLRRGEGPTVFSVLASGASFGLHLTELNPGLAEYFSTDVGLLVLEVDEESDLGLAAGDVILAIDGRQVEDEGDLTRILRSYEENEEVSFTVMRKGQEIIVEGRIR